MQRARPTCPREQVEDDDRPTIDNPPKWVLWDDQKDKEPETRIGKDGKRRRMPRKAPEIASLRNGYTIIRNIRTAPLGLGSDATTVG